jgi:hypothetical protein
MKVAETFNRLQGIVRVGHEDRFSAAIPRRIEAVYIFFVQSNNA